VEQLVHREGLFDQPLVSYIGDELLEVGAVGLYTRGKDIGAQRSAQ